METSRRREFHDVRSNSAASETRSIRSIKLSERPISEACVNCVNLILADRQRTASKDEKLKSRAEFRKNYQSISEWTDPQLNYRENMKRDALAHNSKMIEEQKRSKLFEKEKDYEFSVNTEKNVKEAEKAMKKQNEEEREKVKEYYSEIHNQYIDEINKKQHNKYSKSNNPETYQGLPLYNPDRTQEKLQYKQELERQMKEKQTNEKQEKVRKHNEEKRLIHEYNVEADKYHADNYQSMKMSKAEVFDGLKNIEKDRKRKIEDERKKNDNERILALKEENEYRSKTIKLKMKEMSTYVSNLKNQLLEKEERMRDSKIMDSRFTETFHKSTEELKGELEIKKECKGCQKEYPQFYISSVPKKV